MAEALYRKYRPTTFSDVVGQEHIERTLKNAIEQDKVSHAYLFCGPRGTGKTTTARILAKALLCEHGPTVEPDGTCEDCLAIAQGTHPDVYELDAASRTGVENVREEIISRVHYAPTRGAYKIYIIDEVHMLSNAAFNALLKTLEEPPSHVVFILCTTDPQQVPETIHSRCQRFDFHRISTEAMVARLGAICVQEGVEFEPEALELIAHRADGGMRNALTSLEQLIAFDEGHVSLVGAQSLLGAIDKSDVSELVDAIARRDGAQCFEWTARFVETGADLAQFCVDLADYFRNMYLLGLTQGNLDLSLSDAMKQTIEAQMAHFSADRLGRILMILDETIREMRVSSNPRLSFEIALMRMTRPVTDLTLEALAQRIEDLEAKLAGTVVSEPQAMPEPAPVTTHTVSEQDSAAVPQPVSAPSQVAPASAPVQPASGEPLPAAPESFPTTATVAAAQQPASVAHAGKPALSDPLPAASTTADVAALNLESPANLQRLWHSVVTTLKKENPARGVLFMNAQVSFDNAEQQIVIEFAAENSFTYNAVQKQEVRNLLSQTLARIAGGEVRYRFVLAQAAAPASHSASTLVASAPASAPTAVAAPAPTAPASSAAVPAPAVKQPTQPAQPAQPADASVESKQPVAPTQPTPPASTPAPITPPSAVSTAAAAPMPPTQPTPSARDEVVESSMHTAAATSNSQPAEDFPEFENEDERIKAILTASFGEGIKFENVDE